MNRPKANPKTPSSSRPITQAFLLKHILPRIKMQGQLYTKYGEVIARKVTKTEEVITTTSSGLETKNVAQKGDYIVTNSSTVSKEQYVVLNEKFNSRYKKIKTISRGVGLYKPIGTVQAIQVSKTIHKILNRASTFYIMAAWGEKQMVKKGDYLACPIAEDEVYRIGRKEFMDTYSKGNNY